MTTRRAVIGQAHRGHVEGLEVVDDVVEHVQPLLHRELEREVARAQELGHLHHSSQSEVSTWSRD